jgi:hypothetical protein
MIDTLLGVVVLALLTSWMLAATSIQSRLLVSSSSRLSTREQLDYLRAAALTGFPSCPPANPEDFLGGVRSFGAGSLQDLRSLLVDPQTMAREDGEEVDDIVKTMQENEQYPFTTKDGDLDENSIQGFLVSGKPGEPGNLNLPDASNGD